MSKRIETDLNTFIKFWLVPIGILLALLFIEKASVGIILIGISIFLALALKPLVRKVDNFFVKIFGKDKNHDTLSVILAYLIVVLVVGSIIAIVGPVVVNETSKFIDNFPRTFESTFGGWDGINAFGRNLGIGNLQNEIANTIDSLSKNLMGMLGNNLISSVSGAADIIMKIVLVLVLTLLILLEGPEMLGNMWKGLEKHQNQKKKTGAYRRVVCRMANVVSTYVSRQLTVAAIDGTVTALIVFILSLVTGLPMHLALPMGMITMIFYMIPMFGQFIGGTLVTVLLLFSNPLAGAIFGVIYIVYAQIENNLIAPKIQGDALNLKPLVILGATIIGMYTFGLAGAIIAIPIAGCIKVLIEEYPNIKATRE